MDNLKATDEMSEEELDKELKAFELQAKKDKIVEYRASLDAKMKKDEEDLRAQTKEDLKKELQAEMANKSTITANQEEKVTTLNAKDENEETFMWSSADRQKFRIGNGSNYVLHCDSDYDGLIEKVCCDSYIKVGKDKITPENLWGMSKDENFWMKATNDTTAANWLPDRNYVDDMIEAAVCHSQLSGVITRRSYDVNKGEGGRVDIPYTPARTAQGPIGTCACLTDTSSTLGKYYVTLGQYGDSDLICDFTEFKSKYNIRANIGREMGKALAAAWDTNIWTAITVFMPTYTYTLGHAWTAGMTSDSCCMNAVDLYNGIIQLTKALQGAAYHPTHVIMHPTVAAHLYYKDASGVAEQQLPLVKMNNGKLTMVGELEVIESCNATAGTDVSGTTLAVIVDKSRSVAEAWGKRPDFGTFYELRCNRTRLAVWAYWGTSRLEAASIGHILNP